MKKLKVEKRDWDIVNFEEKNIKRVIELAFEWAWEEKIDIELIMESVLEDIKEEKDKSFPKNTISVEEIQDIVEKNLVKFNKYYPVKSFIIYREQRQKEREKERQEYIKKFEKNKLKVTKRNWKKENFDIEKIEKVYDLVSKWFKKTCKFEDLVESLKEHVIDWIETKEITKLLIKSALNLISVENTHWQNIASRLLMVDLYKQATENRGINHNKVYTKKAYVDLFYQYIDEWLYSPDFTKNYTQEDIEKAWEYIQKNRKRDMKYNYTTSLMLSKRYLLNPNKLIRELPQEMYMSVALFLAIPEKNEERLEKALEIYDQISTQKISLPTPTLLNARTPFHQLSSCFKLNVEDDLRAIYHNIENMAQISKFGGGIWVYLGNIRSRGSKIRHTKWASGWVNPWIKVINDTAIAVNQLWARAGAISTTLDIWHKDIHDFLELQTETWDMRLKSFDVFPAVSIPDLFMERVQNDEDWTLFDPKEVEDITWRKLQDNFCEDFEEFYKSLEKRDDIELKETVKAKDLFKTFMKTVVETWMPYVFFRDTVNRLNPNKHAWNVYSSQLCVEICQNTTPSKFVEETLEDGKIVIKYEPGDSVVCNLASINIAKVNTKKQAEETVPVAARILDNVITLNFYPIKESEITAKKYRSVWLWFLGLAEYLAVNHINYDTDNAREEVDKLFERYALETIKASNNLAKERWAYELFKWSDWDKWIIFGKDEKWFEENSDIKNEWKDLLKNIKKDWVRFWYHLAPAPNTSTAQVVGTTASILPIYKKYFVETNSVAPSVVVAPGLNKWNFWYYKEYVNTDLGEVIDMVSTVYKWIDQSISFEWMINPNQISPAQLYQYYLKSWKQWIKTIYYVRSMSWEIDDSCASCSW